ncbi:BatD family protein [Chondrinema litorale]|uniref:BatD family protein n=1 Tax=Chondrinema litorale TaxID=2994555 RepID=UPI0025434F0A|nr:BatD family protein [Chondrinema litorale]UZR92827.1 BatD family protein [Chondrinema litorale]
MKELFINKSLLSIVLLFSSVTSLLAQDVNFSVNAPKVVATGENFRFIYSVNADGENFRANDFPSDIRILSGPNRSTSSSVQIINGKMSQSMTQSYTYYAVASKEGNITLPSAIIEVDGEEYTSDPFTVEVVKGNTQAQQQNSQGSMNQTNVPQSEIADKDLFVRVELSDKEVYQGESLVATLKVYTRVDLEGFDDIRYPAFNGFWSDDLDVSTRISLDREAVNGEIYQVGTFKKVLLFPQQSGKLTLEPFELDCVVRQRVRRRRRSNDPFSMFDDMLGGSYQRVLKKVASPALTLNVKPLPVTTRPSSFHGAVGDLKLTSSVDLTAVKSNEPVTFTVKVSGNGNLKFVDPLKINFPPDLEVYGPKIDNNFKATNAGTTGSKTFEYLVIPRRHGNYTIPSVDFSWFNPSTGKYETASTESYEINVEKGTGDDVTVVNPTLSKENVQMLGKDIRYIKTDDVELNNPISYFVGSTGFYLTYIIPLGLFGAFLFYARTKRKESENISLVKNKKAGKVAKKRLQQAEKYMAAGQKDQFYKELLDAFWGYIGDKLSLERAEMTKDFVKERLIEYQISEDQANAFIKFMDECEFAQFAPSAGASMKDVYDRAIQQISDLESNIQKKATVKTV